MNYLLSFRLYRMYLTTLMYNHLFWRWLSFIYIYLLQGKGDPVDVVDSLIFIFVGVYFFVFYPYDTSQEHVSCFLHRFLVFKHQVESFLHSLSINWLLFYQISFCQLCVYWFVGILDPVKRVDLVEGYEQLSNFGVLRKTCYLL